MECDLSFNVGQQVKILDRTAVVLEYQKTAKTIRSTCFGSFGGPWTDPIEEISPELIRVSYEDNLGVIREITLKGSDVRAMIIRDWGYDEAVKGLGV